MACWTAEQGRKTLESGIGSDFTIDCQGKSWNVHKIVISTVSEHFKSLCYGSFKVSSILNLVANRSLNSCPCRCYNFITNSLLQEAQEAKAELNDQDPEVLNAILNWIYTGKYLLPDLKARSLTLLEASYTVSLDSAKANFAMYQSADYLGIAELADLAGKHLDADFRMLVVTRNTTASGLLAMVLPKTGREDPVRLALFETIGMNIQLCREDDVLLAEVRKHEPAAWAMLDGIPQYPTFRNVS
jgi:hypothetical protein